MQDAAGRVHYVLPRLMVCRNKDSLSTHRLRRVIVVIRYWMLFVLLVDRFVWCRVLPVGKKSEQNVTHNDGHPSAATL